MIIIGSAGGEVARLRGRAESDRGHGSRCPRRAVTASAATMVAMKMSSSFMNLPESELLPSAAGGAAPGSSLRRGPRRDQCDGQEPVRPRRCCGLILSSGLTCGVWRRRTARPSETSAPVRAFFRSERPRGRRCVSAGWRRCEALNDGRCRCRGCDTHRGRHAPRVCLLVPDTVMSDWASPGRSAGRPGQ